MNNNAPIGIFDSGSGGLSVVKELINLMPNERIIYFGDTLHTPYGSRSPAEILRFMHKIFKFLDTQDIKMAIIACNTITVLGLELALKRYPFFIVGANTGLKTALKISKNKNIGLIATQTTVASGKHGKDLRKLNPNFVIYPEACPKLVPLIENEQLNSLELREVLKEYLSPLIASHIDTLILGCTHYSYIRSIIKNIVGENIKVIDPAKDTAEDALNILTQKKQLSEYKKGNDKFYFSANIEKTRRLAKLIIKSDLPEFEIINLDDFSS